MSVEKDPNGNKFIPYMREDRLPHIFCQVVEMVVL